MVDPVFSNDTYQLASKLLDVSAMRNEAIAANIANSDTPAYRRIDVSPDFTRQLRSAVEAGDAQRLSGLQPRLTEDTSARSMRPDGNSVDIEQELVAMNRNSVEYDYLTEVVTHNIKELKMAISGHSSA